MSNVLWTEQRETSYHVHTQGDQESPGEQFIFIPVGTFKDPEHVFRFQYISKSLAVEFEGYGQNFAKLVENIPDYIDILSSCLRLNIYYIILEKMI